MEFQKFNPKIHDNLKVVELIINSTVGYNYYSSPISDFKNNTNSSTIQNLLNLENIYILTKDNHYVGVIIFSYCKKSNSLTSLLKLLLGLKVNEFLERLYMVLLKSDIEIKDDDVYLDLIYIEPGHRSDGKGAFLLNNMIQLSRLKNKKQVVLEVDSHNIVARNFYEKMGFEYVPRDAACSNFLTMTYNINRDEKRV